MAIIEVPPGGSIQAAVTASAPGDVILVEDGVFHEAVTVDGGKNNIRIVAKHKHGAVLDGQSVLTTAFTLTNVSGVEINGFVIENYTNFGIQTHLGGGNHRIVKNKIKNIIGGVEIGIRIDNDGNLVWRNEIKRNGGGGIYKAAITG